MRIRHALIAGGGIGGLATALALHRQGWTVTVVERAVSLAPVGAGIGLAPNAVRALRELGVADEVRACSASHEGMGIRHPSGRWLVFVDEEKARRRFGEPFAVLHRADLVRILADRLPPETLHLKTRVEGVETGTGERPARVSTSQGDFDADLVVAADGLRSGLRSRLFPAHPGPVHAGFTAWRIVVPAPGCGLLASETWGNSGVVGVLPMAEGRVYCYATGVMPPGKLFEDERAETLRRFGDWHAPIPDLFAAAAPETVLRNDVFHLARPLPSLHRGRVAFLGDAAHPMAPNLGQGACQAIEDAVVLAHVAGDGTDIPRRVYDYTAARLERTTAMVRRSAKVGAMVHRDSPAAVRTRWTLAAVAGRLPFGATARSLRPITGWHPPRLGGEPGTPGR
ncbi:FAD-dependent monooxygenase [Allosalinactinospora lopnorensis]|uniref:FAD-dependent monooxygenase n=1 Tax=Allosalinactinospora lopnorensis TaxID=1352348 RepID=UPI000623E3B4|nr:FAD-dependent monooxygenase [Allosalinactinospora lopnorensis]